MRAWRCILYTTMWWVWRCRKWKSRIAYQNLRSADRSAVKIHRRAFVSCSRVKACSFSGFVNISSETFLEKLSPLNELRNRWRSMRKTTSPKKTSESPGCSSGSLARKKFSNAIWTSQFDLARSRVQTPLKSWLFQASRRNCLNSVHNCDDHNKSLVELPPWKI